MKVINVSELKVHLSRYLRLASQGTRIVVKDRDEPLAELLPVQQEPRPWRERLAHYGRLRKGTQAWDQIRITRLDRPVDIQSSLQAVRGDADEVR